MCYTKSKQINKRQSVSAGEVWIELWAIGLFPDLQTWAEIRWENTLSPKVVIDYLGNLEAWS